MPLGGTGEIGMNMNLYGHNGQWLMVDCGVMFDRNEAAVPGSNRVLVADPYFIEMQRQRLVGLVISHAHEDHIGAVPYVWEQLQCPVYATPFSAEILRRKISRTALAEKIPIVEIESGQRHQIGDFDLHWLGVTHSIPDPNALLIRTRVGNVLHTADWKIDPNPVIGNALPKSRFTQLAYENITAMVCDSTNAMEPGHSLSEADCYAGLKDIIASASGRVVVSCFGSNIARLITLNKIAQATDRFIGLYGRSLHNMVGAATKTGHWPPEAKFAEGHHLGYLPAHEVLAVATGSQGEPMAALNKLSYGEFRHLDLQAGDTVIFSSKVIPGNEEAVAALIKRFRQRDIHVFEDGDTDLPIHASGHPCQEELKLLYDWVKPKISIPVHGEKDHITAHANLAKNIGVPTQLRGKDGDLYLLAPRVGIKRKVAKVGALAIDQNR